MNENQRSLPHSALTATTHCLTGCAIVEVTGMVIATALGWSAVSARAPARVRLRHRLDRPDGDNRQRVAPARARSDASRAGRRPVLVESRGGARDRVPVRVAAQPLADRVRGRSHAVVHAYHATHENHGTLESRAA